MIRHKTRVINTGNKGGGVDAVRQQTPSKKRKPATADINAAASNNCLVFSGLKKLDRGWVILQTRIAKNIALMDSQKSRFLTAEGWLEPEDRQHTDGKNNLSGQLLWNKPAGQKSQYCKNWDIGQITGLFCLETLV